MKAFVTVIGEDKIGIIHGVTGILKQFNVNVLDINQTLLQGYFTMIMFVDLVNMNIDFAKLIENLDQLSDTLGVKIKLQHEDIFNSMHTI